MTYAREKLPHQKVNITKFNLAASALVTVTLPFDQTQGKRFQEQEETCGVRCVWIKHTMKPQSKETNLNACDGLAKLQTLQQFIF